MISASPRRLDVFRTIADTGSFNLAAEKLGIAQPSVSAHVTALERQIGQPLFHRRRGSRPKLTQAGETLYAYAVEALRQGEETQTVLNSARARKATEIAIAAQRDIAQYFLPQHLTGFAARHPGIRFVTHTGTFEDALAQVRERSVDVGLMITTGPERGLHTQLLGRDPLLFVVSPSHPLANVSSVAPKDLAAHPFVMGLRHSRYVGMIDAILKKLGVGPYAIAMEAQDFASVRELARHGAGIACMSSFCVQDELKAGTLVALKLNVPAPQMELRCAYHLPASDIVRDFVESLSTT